MEGYLGTIMMCGFSFAPQSWAFCNGGTVPVSQNPALFSLLGTNFGGDGRTSFGLPNLSGGIVPGGQGDNPRGYRCELGQQIGYKEFPLSVNQLPAHNHQMREKTPGQSLNVESTGSISANKTSANSSSPENNFWAPTKSGMSNLNSYATSQDTTMSANAIDIQTTGSVNVSNLEIENTGQSQPIIPLQPTLGLNFVICINGLFPSRS